MSNIAPRPGSVNPRPSNQPVQASRKLGFVYDPIPRDLHGRGLNASQKLLFGVLFNIARMDCGVCKAFNSTLAKLCECSDREIRRDLDVLKAKGLVRCEHLDNDPRKARKIHITWTPPDDQAEPKVIKLGGGTNPSYPTDEQVEGRTNASEGVGPGRPTGRTAASQGVGPSGPTFENSEGEKELSQRAAPPSPASARDEPSPSSPGEGPGWLDAAPHLNVTGYTADGAMSVMMDAAELERARREMALGATRSARGAAFGPGRGPTMRKSADQARADFEASAERRRRLMEDMERGKGSSSA
jgi:hypothetical protein